MFTDTERGMGTYNRPLTGMAEGQPDSVAREAAWSGVQAESSGFSMPTMRPVNLRMSAEGPEAAAALKVTGLDYFGARYYSGGQGRFTSPDQPLIDQNPADPQSWNLYSYVRNNPLGFVDLNGRSCIKLDDGSSGDDGDGKGCKDAGVAPDDKNGKGKITPQVVDVGAESAPGFGSAEWTRQMLRDLPTSFERGNRPDSLNNVFSFFGYDQNDSRPSCFGGFLENTASNINPLPPSLSTVGDLAGQAGTFYWFQRAIQHAATTPSRTFGTPFLMYPNKSSVFRSLLSKSGRASVAGALFSLDIGIFQALVTEFDDLRNGRCQ
jgi:RHS repeat-associated protein